MSDRNRTNGTPLLEAGGVAKSYALGEREIAVLKGVDLVARAGEFLSIIGPSGAGKSTLLHILGTLEQPTGGTVHITGMDVAGMDEMTRAHLRRNELGFVFQFHHLLPAFTALENIQMPALILGKTRAEAEEPARELAEMLGLSHRLDNKPVELSGGEQQRVAVARALINNPSLVLADEPSGNLDRVIGKALEDDLVSFARERGSAVIVVTHNEEWAHRADRVLTLVDGHIEENPA